MKRYNVIIGILAAIFCLLSIEATPGHAYIVYPDDIYWGPDDRTAAENPDNAGTAGISAEEPRSGNASLKLTIGGDEEPLDDWAFYTRIAGDANGWGLLSEVSALSFDWYVKSKDTSAIWYDPWNFQTPVLRLLIEDSGTTSELVWEQYYTDGTTTPMTMMSWVTEDLIDQNFWRYSPDTGYTISTGVDMQNFGTNTLMADALSDWASDAWAFGLDNTILKLYSDNAFVYGISVGVGSLWPGDYLGYVDNVYLAFGENVVLNDNFELPVPDPYNIPEPSAMLLLGTCLATFLAGRRRRARG